MLIDTQNKKKESNKNENVVKVLKKLLKTGNYKLKTLHYII